MLTLRGWRSATSQSGQVVLRDAALRIQTPAAFCMVSPAHEGQGMVEIGAGELGVPERSRNPGGAGRTTVMGALGPIGDAW